MNNKTETITISTHLGDVVGVKNTMDLILKAYPMVQILQVRTGGDHHKNLRCGLNLLTLHLLDLNALNSGWEKGVLEGV